MPLSITTPDGGSASVGIPSEGQTMRLAIGTGMIDAALVAKDFYNAVNLNPEYVADFFESYYRVNKVPSTFSGALNFARTGTATYVDATGTLQTAATGVARTDHHIWNGSAWVNQGLLLESSAATNLLTYSEQFDNAAWTKSNATVTVAGDVYRLSQTATEAEHYLQQTSLPAGAGTFTSVYKVKADTVDSFRIMVVSIGSTPATTAARFNVDLGTGVITSAGVPAGGIVTSVSSKYAGGGFYECRVTYTHSSSVTDHWTRIYPGPSGVFVGDPSLSILVDHAQLETGSISTSYIKTEATTATRNAETLTASAGDLPYNLTAVSIQMEGTVSGTPSTLIDWQADASNLITLSAGASDFTFTQEQAGTVDSVTGGSYTPGINVPFNIASRHGSTFINGAVDGVALTANTTPTALPDLTTTDLQIAPNFNGTIKLLRIWGADIGDTGIAQASD